MMSIDINILFVRREVESGLGSTLHYKDLKLNMVFVGWANGFIVNPTL